MDEESACITRAQQGSSEAFTELVETYQTRVYNLCYRMLGEPEAAEDAAQEAFLRAYQHLRRYDRKRPFATWLLSIAAHYCIDTLRRRRNSISIEQVQEQWGFELRAADLPNPESEVLRGEQQERMHALLGRLDPVDRAAIVLLYWNECSVIEIAEALSLTASAVKSRLHRARRQLAVLWESESALTKHHSMRRVSPAAGMPAAI